VTRFAFLLLYVCTVGLGDSLHLRVVVDASSPAEYNHWLWQRRAAIPGIPPVLITCDSARHRNLHVWPAISFWTDSGPLLRHRIMPDSLSAILQMTNYQISSRNDQLIMTETGYNYAAYDRYGRRLFDDRENRLETGTSGRWFRYVFGRRCLEMLDDSGKAVSVLTSQHPAHALHKSDSVFSSYANKTMVLFDRNGRTLWQSDTLRAPPAHAVAEDGEAVAMATADSLVVHDLAAGKTVALPHDASWSQYGRPQMSWSGDARLLAIYQGSRTSQDSGRVMVLNRSGKTVRPSRPLRAYQVRALLWLGDTLVLPGQDLDTAGMDPRQWSGIVTDSCLLTFVLPDGKQHQLVVCGKFRPYGYWRTSSPYLAYLMPPRRFMVAEVVR